MKNSMALSYASVRLSARGDRIELKKYQDSYSRIKFPSLLGKMAKASAVPKSVQKLNSYEPLLTVLFIKLLENSKVSHWSVEIIEKIRSIFMESEIMKSAEMSRESQKLLLDKDSIVKWWSNNKALTKKHKIPPRYVYSQILK